nr:MULTISPECIES: IS66 family transposase zinc-finger binding domain-containing protein [unclassified Bradyrhizobium]
MKLQRSALAAIGSRLAKVGEDVTKTLEEIPRRFKDIETVREKFTCRDCEQISQPLGAVPCHAARLHRPTIVGDDPVRQLRHAYPAQPPERAL